MVTTIIPTVTGGFHYLVNLLPGLSQEDTEIIIVDNTSRDGTSNYLQNYNCLVKYNKDRMSFSQSNNYGAKKASGDYLLFLNNDTMVTGGFIKEMEKTFDIDPKIGIVGCQIQTMDNPTKIQHIGIMFTDNYLPYELGLPQPEISAGILKNDDRVRSVREVPAITGCCMMIKKDLFQKLGGFDENYVNGWEDVDLCLRARELGYKIWYNGLSSIKHLKFGSRTAGRFLKEQENRDRFDETWVTTGRAKEVLGDFRNA